MRFPTFLPILLALFACQTSFGQCPADTLMWEDFQAQQIPGNWVNLNLDSLNDQNGRAADWFILNDPISSTSASDNYVAASNSWFNPAGVSDNWLITDEMIVCDTNLFLIWKSAPFEGPVYMDGYEVLLSTTTNDPDSFTVNLMTFAEGIGATAQASSGTAHTEYEGNRGILQSWRAALDPWLGDTVYFAFRHHSEDDNLLQLDDIGVVRLPDFDAATVEVSYSTPYPIVPLSQVQPMDFQAHILNAGVDTLSKVSVEMQANVGATQVFIAIDSIFDLAPLGETTVQPALPYTPSQTGNYDFTALTSIDSVDGFPLNNGAGLSFEVNDSVYARDEGDPVGFRNLGANSGFMGQTFELIAPDTLSSISFYLDQPSGQDSLRGAVYAFANSTPGTLLAMTDVMVLTGSSTGWMTLGLDGIDLPLGAGTYLIGLEESSTGELNLGWTESKYSPGAVWHRVQSSWASADALELGGVYMVRANFGKVDEIVGAVQPYEALSFTISPNPGPGVFQLEFRSPLKSKTELKIHDLRGRQVLSRILSGGQSTTQIDLTQQSEGMYILSLGGRSVGKLVVKN